MSVENQTGAAPQGLATCVITGWALVGGLVLIGVVLVNAWSILSGAFFNKPFPGDFELAEMGAGIAVFCFLPYCQLNGANVSADIFTMRAGPRSVTPMSLFASILLWRMSADLFRAANAWLGWMRGGVAMSAIAACAGFGAVCGSSLATASTMGRVALPELKRYAYSNRLGTGTIAAGGVLGILIPPSVVLIVYSIIVEANIVTMFMAALIPGLTVVGFFILTIFVYVLIAPGAGPKGRAATREEFIAATLSILPVGVVFAVVIGGLYFGFFNPIPAAAVGVVMVTLIGLLRRKLNWTDGREAILETARTVGMIYLILLGAEMLKIFVARSGGAAGDG